MLNQPSINLVTSDIMRDQALQLAYTTLNDYPLTNSHVQAVKVQKIARRPHNSLCVRKKLSKSSFFAPHKKHKSCKKTIRQ